MLRAFLTSALLTLPAAADAAVMWSIRDTAMHVYMTQDGGQRVAVARYPIPACTLVAILRVGNGRGVVSLAPPQRLDGFGEVNLSDFSPNNGHCVGFRGEHRPVRLRP